MDALQLRGGGAALHALLLVLALLLVGLAIWQWRRGNRIQAGIAAVTAVLIVVAFVMLETIPEDFTKFAPHLTTLLVLAFASQRLRMPAADGKVYRKGEGH